jgi:hypothetical protein
MSGKKDLSLIIPVRVGRSMLQTALDTTEPDEEE